MADEKPQNVANVAPTSGTASTPEKPYLEMQFEEFLALIGEGNINHWSIMAEALGVDRNTIIRWKRTPQARQAIKVAIAHAMQQMETLGSLDWKMWREKLKMLGLTEKQVIELPGIDNALMTVAEALQLIYKKVDGEIEQQNGNTNPDTNKTEPNQDTGDKAASI